MNTSQINWGLLFQHAKRHKVSQRMIAEHIKVTPPELTYWKEGNSRYAVPPEHKATAVIDYLKNVLSSDELDRCINAQ